MTTTIELSGHWYQDEPLAFLVECFDTTHHEYRVFADEADARGFAFDQEQLARDAGSPEDWSVYPLYAGAQLNLERKDC